jgi:hypothetical protein
MRTVESHTVQFGFCFRDSARSSDQIHTGPPLCITSSVPKRSRTFLLCTLIGACRSVKNVWSTSKAILISYGELNGISGPTKSPPTSGAGETPAYEAPRQLSGKWSRTWTGLCLLRAAECGRESQRKGGESQGLYFVKIGRAKIQRAAACVYWLVEGMELQRLVLKLEG